MPKSTNYADNWFKLLDTNAAYANVGDAGGLQPSAAPGDLYVSLHTGDPGLTGDQTANEVAYTGYLRVAVPRSAAGWVVSGNQVSNVGSITFPVCSALSAVVTWVGVRQPPVVPTPALPEAVDAFADAVLANPGPAVRATRGLLRGALGASQHDQLAAERLAQGERLRALLGEAAGGG